MTTYALLNITKYFFKACGVTQLVPKYIFVIG